ncbi:MAG: sterol desaturase family protein [Flavobacteriales bacterium]|nr:sterol desaturase family protein [Flavobacteriales bacterium]
MEYLTLFGESFLNTLFWTWNSITLQIPWYTNYFWGLIIISLVVWRMEILFPWRKNQAMFRKDFWLDAFYMFFNFFLFSIFISGFYQVVAKLFQSIGVEMSSISLLQLEEISWPIQLLIFFVLQDFVQWFTHTLLHRIPLLWNFHKVHHSVKEMGFAAHLRYHWMENILYKPLKTLAIILLGGFEPEQAYIIHFITIALGHLNHSNIKLTYGPLKYIINNPVMHLYHHAYHLPEAKNGVNYGISLSIWDYLFRTNYVPEESGTIDLGFKGEEEFPKDFVSQNLYGFSNKD